MLGLSLAVLKIIINSLEINVFTFYKRLLNTFAKQHMQEAGGGLPSM